MPKQPLMTQTESININGFHFAILGCEPYLFENIFAIQRTQCTILYSATIAMSSNTGWPLQFRHKLGNNFIMSNAPLINIINDI